MKELSWGKFKKLRGHEKFPFFEKDGDIFHVIMAQQFNRHLLDLICDLATKTRNIAKTRQGKIFLKDLLPHKRAMLYFSQPSSRTFLSFMAACQTVGMDTVELRDLSTSSEKKGETQEDSVRTFSSYVDLIIMRHHLESLAEKMAWVFNPSKMERPVPVLNAGSGKDQHPTQALLDIYTLQRSFENQGGIEGITIAMVGDLKRGRTVRSLSYLLQFYEGIRIIFVAPKELQMRQDIKGYLEEKGIVFSETEKLEDVVKEADAFYITRIQDEWGGKEVNYEDFSFKPEFLKTMKPNAIIMHPFPRRKEIPVEIDNDKRAMYWRQMRNGMWTRVALMVLIFNEHQKVLDY